MVSSVTATDVTCNGAANGAIDLTVTGGTLPYTILWSTFQGSEDISGLDGGLYYVIVTDAKGCEIKDFDSCKRAGMQLYLPLRLPISVALMLTMARLIYRPAAHQATPICGAMVLLPKI